MSFPKIFSLCAMIMMSSASILGVLSPGTVEASSEWLQTSDTDFAGGNCTNLVIDNEGSYASLDLIPDYTGWSNVTASAPAQMSGHAMATVSGTSMAIMFGGLDTVATDETWRYDVEQEEWSKRAPLDKPCPRRNHALASVPTDDSVVLFGGIGDRLLKDTWKYDLGDDIWIYHIPSDNPPPREGCAMAGIGMTCKVLLFGGQNDSDFLDDTWIFDVSADSWEKMNPSGCPPAMAWHSMAGVPNDDKVVLFGGRDTTPFADTWVYDLSENSWTKMDIIFAPTARSHASMACISPNGNLILFGGWLKDSSPENDTWIYSISTNKWALKTPKSCPSPREGFSMAGFPGPGKALLVGGLGDSGMSETWVYEKTNDTWMCNSNGLAPCGRYEHAMAEYEDGTLLFGGYRFGFTDEYLCDTWIYNASKNFWTPSLQIGGPSARNAHSIASAGNHSCPVLFGGLDLYGALLNDTWIFNSTESRWIRVSPQMSPSARYKHAMAGLDTDDKIVLFGGFDDYYDSETWVFDISEGKWQNMSPPYSPTARYGHAMAAVANDDKLILCGGFDGGIRSDSWCYDLSENRWYQSRVFGPSMTEASMVSVADDDKIILFGGYSWNEYGGSNISNSIYFYDFSEDKWYMRPSHAGPSSRYGHSMARLGDHTKYLLFGGWDKGYSPEAWTYSEILTKLGEYTSPSYDTGAQSRFLELSWFACGPMGATLDVQLRTGKTQAELGSKSFVGPDGSNCTEYKGKDVCNFEIWSGHNGDRWIQYKARFQSFDPCGTLSLDWVKITFNRPPVTVIGPMDGAWSSDNHPVFQWKYIDTDGSEQESWHLDVSKDPEFSSIIYSREAHGISDSTPLRPEGVEDGVWYWRVRAKDFDGEWSQFSDTGVFKIDTTPPSHLRVRINQGEMITDKRNVLLELSGYDEGSGIKMMALSTDGSCYSEWEPFRVTKNWYLEDKGWNRIYMKVMDGVGLTATSVGTDIVYDPTYLDKDPPQILEVWPEDGSVLEKINIRIGARFFDESGFRHRELKLDGESIQIFSEANDNELSFIADRDLPYGLHMVEIVLEDNTFSRNRAYGSWYFTKVPPVREVRLSPSEAVIEEWQQFRFTAKALDKNGVEMPLTPDWQVDWGDIGRIDQSGNFYAAGANKKGVISVTYGNLTAHANITIIPHRIPIAGSLISSGDLVSGCAVQFTTKGSKEFLGGPLDYQFDFGDGAISEWVWTQNTSHTYEKGGKYLVRYRVRDLDGTVSKWSSTASIDIKTSMPPLIVTATYVMCAAILVPMVGFISIVFIGDIITWRRIRKERDLEKKARELSR
jgi:hypothetical protein